MNQFFELQLLLNPTLVFPKTLFIPAQYLFEGGNILNSDYSPISFKQHYDFYKDLKIENSEYLSFFECNDNVTIFYANDEQLSIIDENTLGKIPNKKLIRVEGLERVIKEDIIKREEPPF